MSADPFRIDVHHHIYAPDYVDLERERVRALTHAFFERVSRWTPEQSIESMDRSGTRLAMLSMSTPGVWFCDNGQAISYARGFNDHVAGIKARHTGRFGQLAAVPLPA